MGGIFQWWLRVATPWYRLVSVDVATSASLGACHAPGHGVVVHILHT